MHFESFKIMESADDTPPHTQWLPAGLICEGFTMPWYKMGLNAGLQTWCLPKAERGCCVIARLSRHILHMIWVLQLNSLHFCAWWWSPFHIVFSLSCSPNTSLCCTYMYCRKSLNSLYALRCCEVVWFESLTPGCTEWWSLVMAAYSAKTTWSLSRMTDNIFGDFKERSEGICYLMHMCNKLFLSGTWRGTAWSDLEPYSISEEEYALYLSS